MRWRGKDWLSAEVRVLGRVVVAGLVVLGLQLAVPGAGAAQGPEAVAYDFGQIQVSAPPGAPPLPVHGSQPAVSPDGSQLAWVATAGTRPHVFAGSLDGSGAHQLTTGDASDRFPSWSPDGHWIAYSRAQDGQDPQVWVVAADGTQNHLLGPYPGDAPVWSPDGRFLAFNAPGGRVEVADYLGRGLATLASGMALWDWSPDGTRLAVRRLAVPGVGLLRMGDRSTTTVLADPNGERFERAEFSASAQQLYVNHEGVTKDNLSSTLERWSLDGTRDATFAPQQMQFDGDIAVGGGMRGTPAATAPAAVSNLSASASPSRMTLHFARPTAPESAGVTIRYAEGTTAPVTVTDGTDGGESLASVFTVNRLAPSTTYSFSVFTRDWSGASSQPTTVTATTPADVATTATLAGPGALTYGQSSALTGSLVREDTGGPVPDAPVVLLGHHTGRPDSVLATLRTDANGRFSTRRLTSENTRYSVRYGGAGLLDPSAATALVSVRQRVTISFSPSARVPAYSRASVTVAIAPAFPGASIRVRQFLYSGGVNVLMRLNSRSQATVRLDTSKRDTYGSVGVTPGARRGYLNDPAFARFVTY